jgi:Fe-S cluster assembly iron-binding protein IscA
MLQLTSDAVTHLARIRRERGQDGTAVRLIRNNGRLGLTFAAAPEPGDRTIGAGEITVCVPPDVAETLADSTIDVKTEEGKSLLVARPNETRTGDARAN